MLPTSITTRLQYQHKSVIELTDGLNDEQIRRNIEPGKWSIFENIAHLATYQHTFNTRVRKIVEGGVPTFERYSAEADPMFHDKLGLSTREVMQDLLSLRKLMAAAIPNLDESDFLKAGIHPFYGRMTLLQWLNFFLLHEAHHLFTIFRLAAALKQRATTF